MDVDILTQVLIVRDQGQGPISDVVKLHVLPKEIVLHAVVQTQEIFATFSNGDFGPWSIVDRHEVVLEVHLDLESLENRPSHQEWCGTFNDEAFHVATLAIDVDWESHRPICLTLGITSKPESLVGGHEQISA